MSNVLLIRHLPTALSFKDKEQLLKHFGADKVWEKSTKRNYVFASFASVDKAKASLNRLHQLEIAQRRLVVEYSFEKEPIKHTKQDIEQTSVITKHVKEYLRVLNAWNPSINFYQAPPAHLNYKYPKINHQIAINIVHSLFNHKPFYTQSLHLMNKMCLKTPFNEDEEAVQFFKETFKNYFMDLHILPEEELESELSSDESRHEIGPNPKLIKRKHILPKVRKRPLNMLAMATLPKSKKVCINQEEVFETVTPIQEPKKISLVVHQDALQRPAGDLEVVGELGKFQKEEQPVNSTETVVEEDGPTITKKELQKNRISYKDMKVLPVFKNYHPGLPSMRLYIKNLAKTVTEQDVKRIYRRYIGKLSDEEQIGFDVRVMQEGKMKGQAFVTFPSVSIAEAALHDTNGYMLKERPMVVQFARAAIKKSVD